MHSRERDMHSHGEGHAVILARRGTASRRVVRLTPPADEPGVAGRLSITDWIAGSTAPSGGERAPVVQRMLDFAHPLFDTIRR